MKSRVTGESSSHNNNMTTSSSNNSSSKRHKQTFACDSLPDGGLSRRSLEITNTMPRYESTADMPSRFGEFGGKYIPETLMQAHEQLEEIYVTASKDPEFQIQLEKLGRDF